MGTIKKSITFTEQQETYIKSLVDNGFYTNESEYVRDVISKDQESRRNILDLHEALADGINCGTSSATVDTIWGKAMQDYAKR